MTWEEFLARWGIGLALTLINCLGGWILWSLSKKFVTTQKCEEHREHIQTDITAQKDALAKMPTAKDVEKLGEKLDAVTSGLDSLKGEFVGVNHLTKLMTEYLMKGDK